MQNIQGATKLLKLLNKHLLMVIFLVRQKLFDSKFHYSIQFKTKKKFAQHYQKSA